MFQHMANELLPSFPIRLTALFSFFRW